MIAPGAVAFNSQRSPNADPLRHPTDFGHTQLIFDVIPYIAELALFPRASHACPKAGPSNAALTCAGDGEPKA
jgi:hypothetical protein